MNRLIWWSGAPLYQLLLVKLEKLNLSKPTSKQIITGLPIQIVAIKGFIQCKFTFKLNTSRSWMRKKVAINRLRFPPGSSLSVWDYGIPPNNVVESSRPRQKGLGNLVFQLLCYSKVVKSIFFKTTYVLRKDDNCWILGVQDENSFLVAQLP